LTDTIQAMLEEARHKTVERMSEDSRYAKVSGLLSAAIRTLAEIDGNQTKPDIEGGV
jgi:hypothetical protein